MSMDFESLLDAEIEGQDFQEKIIWYEHEVEVILPSEALEWARLFEAKQPDVETGKRVYLNTLAVYAVHFFLERNGIETDLEESDCWYPNLATPFDVADLLLPEIGSVECRPVMLDRASEIKLPELEWSDRIGYIAVGFGEVLDRARLLCYFPAFKPDAFIPDSISLNSPDRLPICDLMSRLKAIRSIEEVWAECEDTEEVFIEAKPLLEPFPVSALAARLERIYLEPDPYLQAHDMEALFNSLGKETGTPKREVVSRGIELKGIEQKGAAQELTDDEVDEGIEDLASRFAARFRELLDQKLQNLGD